MSDAKRRNRREPLRVGVNFWEIGYPTTLYTGITENVSATGVFVACNSPFPTETAVGIRVDDQSPLVVSGVVARIVMADPSLDPVMKQGMGIAFYDEESTQVRRLNQMPKESLSL